jgi:hypothetical protein
VKQPSQQPARSALEPDLPYERYHEDRQGNGKTDNKRGGLQMNLLSRIEDA